MAIIDSAGLFLGDRLAWCSDGAQLHWPRLYSVANNYARLELNYRKVISKAYANFQSPPTEEEFWSMIHEFKTNFLLFVYRTPDGVIWGQWQTSERYLLGHKNADDKRSPIPPIEEQEMYRKSYLAEKAMRTNKNQQLADLLGVVPSCSALVEKPEVTPVGVGVGEGGGTTPLPPLSGGLGKREQRKLAAASVGMFKGADMTAEQREEVGRQETLAYWRDIRGRDPAHYARRADAWARKILDADLQESKGA